MDSCLNFEQLIFHLKDLNDSNRYPLTVQNILFKLIQDFLFIKSLDPCVIIMSFNVKKKRLFIDYEALTMLERNDKQANRRAGL